MPYYTNPKRYWFTERDKLAFVEGGSSTTVDGVTSKLVSISEAKSCIVKRITLPNVFPTGTDEDYASSLTDTSAGPLEEIPLQFHEALAWRVIAQGYLPPQNLNPQLAQAFSSLYAAKIKDAKKYAKRHHTSGGFITPVDF